MGAERELSAWYVSPVAKKPVRMGDWVGSVKEGSAVNFFDISFNPHGNGTHTECYGHIDKEQESVNKKLSRYHFLCRVVRLEPREKAGDRIVGLEDLRSKVDKLDGEALIIQTGTYQLGHNFSGTNPTYFESDLLEWVREQGVEHFLTDLPSVDREEDGGALAAHKAFWHYPQHTRKTATITELLYCPEPLDEGLFLLNLQTAAFENDAAPSRPVIYPLTEL